MSTDASGPYLKIAQSAENKREQQRKPPPLALRGVAEAEAGEEEQQVGDDPAHGGFIPRRAQSRITGM